MLFVVHGYAFHRLIKIINSKRYPEVSRHDPREPRGGMPKAAGANPCHSPQAKAKERKRQRDRERERERKLMGPGEEEEKRKLIEFDGTIEREASH